MNVNDFYTYIESPNQLNATTVAELQEVLEVYPYFQTAHVLYLKSLYNQNNFKFNDQLKFSSVHLNNRKKLLYFLKDKTASKAEFIQPSPKKENLISTPKKHTKPTEQPTVSEQNTKEKKTETKVVSKEKKVVVPESIVKEKREEPKIRPFVANKVWLFFIPKRIVEKKIKQEQEQPIEKKADILESPIKPVVKPKESVKQEPKVHQVSDIEKLSPQDIIQKRLEELNRKPKTEEKASSVSVQKKDKTKKLSEEKSSLGTALEDTTPLKVEKEKKLALPKKEVEKVPLVEEKDYLLDELSDLIQVAPPSEYFLAESFKEKEKPKESPSPQKQKTIFPAKTEKHSFSYWLNHLQDTKEPKQEQPQIKVKKDKSALIDSFLSNKYVKTKPVPNTPPKVQLDDTVASESGKESFMTETLAEIYIKQAYYDKAIDAYQKLSLKYPKKNTYFASRIEKIKKLQLNS